MVRHNEFSVVAEDGTLLRIREALPVDPASNAPISYVLLNPTRAAAIELLSDGRYRDGKFYVPAATLSRR